MDDPFPQGTVLSVGVVIISYAVLATAWNFVGGFTGYISLGHAAYSGLGGYATGLLILRADVNPWVALLLGGLVVAVFAVPVGIAALRVRARRSSSCRSRWCWSCCWCSRAGSR
jgi:branched-chain amino acid transport system permease protein